MTYRFGVKTDFSISNSLLTVEKVASLAKEKNFDGIVITDDMTISAMPIISRALAGTNVKTMFGVAINVYDDATYKQPPKKAGVVPKDNKFFCIKVYAKNHDGIKEIFKALTKANTEDRFYYVPRCDIDDILEMNNIVLSTGDFFSLFYHPNYETIGKKLVEKFKEDFAVEICPVNSPLFDRVNQIAYKFGVENNCRFLVTLPALYERDEQIPSLNVSKAIYRNTQINAQKAVTLHLQQVRGLVLDCDKDALQGLLNAFIDRCKNPEMHKHLDNFETLQKEWCEKYSYVFEKKQPCLPKMADDEFQTLRDECIKGWKKRLMTEVLGYRPKPEQTPIYRERLLYELSILKKMNFSGYFLLVQDLVKHCKENGIFVGPARGSSGGSLVAFLMGITDIDPIRFNLIFERFINPERIDLPDIDMDYQSTRRQNVIDYLTEKYGEDCVSGISNYSTLGSASAVRDAGRVFGLPIKELDITKLMPKEHGSSLSLTEAGNTVPEIGAFRDSHKTLWNHALNLEGIMRNLGRHAAGTVVAGEPLVNRSVVERRSGATVVNWDKRIVEDMGLIKMDILGLSTLDTLAIAKKYLKENRGIDIDYTKLPLNDEKTLEAFGRGDTTGVFQFESTGMKGLLKSLAKRESLTFNDISTATALFRPGPLDSGLLDEYVKIKQGLKAPSYAHPAMKPALESTYGVMVYQEQVMQVARDLAGFTMAESDFLRKAIGKKDLKKLKKFQEKFINGAVEKSQMNEEDAKQLWNNIEKFGFYCFNESHSTAYSVVSYWTCYLKTHYPAEYFASCLSIVADDKYEDIVTNAKECGIDILPPQINYSTDKFVIHGENQILAPFSSVKFLSEITAKKIMELREKAGGKFKDKAEFIKYAGMTKSGVNKRVVENLDKVGAFCEIEPTDKPINDPSRVKDQKELMGGLIVNVVKATRTTTKKDVASSIRKVCSKWKSCDQCSLCDGNHCNSVMGKNEQIKFMVITDCPNFEEDKSGKFMVGKLSKQVLDVMKDCGLDPQDGYYTGIVKAKKEDKFLSGSQVSQCSQFINEEIDIIKPAVVIALGSEAVRKFVKDARVNEVKGKAIYDAETDTTVVCGINPAQALFDESKWQDLSNVFKKAKEVLN